MIKYKALAVLDIMQCLIGFSKRGCCHDTYDVEVVAVQIFISWCSRSARSPPPRSTPLHCPIVSHVLFLLWVPVRSTQLLHRATHTRQENNQYSKRRQDAGRSTTPKEYQKERLIPLVGCPIPGPRNESCYWLSTSSNRGLASTSRVDLGRPVRL